MRYILIILLTAHCCFAQNNSNRDTLAIPGEEYKAGWLHKLIFGAHWRELWTTPVRANILDLKTFAGGLTPYERGGGFQTKTLRFKGNDGKIYKFRSINKDPSKLLPEELQKSVVASVLHDQISSSHPLAPLVAAPLLNEVGVLNAQPYLVFLPDNAELKEYRKDFGNLLGFIEEHPDKSDMDTIGFAGSDKVKSTFKLFNDLEKNNSNHVDAAAYLKSRLMDILMGDWDRHVDQWRWARYKKGDQKIWEPIPRDRDQVFAKYDGILSWGAEIVIPQIEGFKYSFPEIEDLTWSGRFLDKKFLTRLTRSEWDSVTNYVKAKITDEVIKGAVNKLPTEWVNICGDELISKLIYRRNHLSEASDDYYDLIFDQVDILCSDKDESAFIKRMDNDHVKVFIRNKEKDGIVPPPFYERIFDCSETSQIRIDMLDGDDSVYVDGDVDRSITVKISGGEGKDVFIDNSVVHGFALNLLPIPSAEDKTYFFDSGNQSMFVDGPGTTIIKRKFVDPETETEKYEPKTRNWGIDWKFKPLFDYNTDEGLIIGGGPILYKFGYKVNPYVFRMHLVAGYSFYLSNYVVEFQSDFFGYNENIKYHIDAKKSELSITNYFGQGNETKMNKDLEGADYYKVGNELYVVNSNIEYRILPKAYFLYGASFKHSETKLKDSTLVKIQDPYGNQTNTFINFYSGFRIDSRDHMVAPSKGYTLNLFCSVYPKIFKRNDESFYKIISEAAAFTSFNILTDFTFGVRGRAEKIWGKYPFYESAFLGGSHSVKGYFPQRFAGDAAIEFNSELRVHLSKVNILIPGNMGFTLFTDVGRVFLSGEKSAKWHPGYGGGLWCNLIDKDYTFSLTYAKSPEDYGIYVKYGFSF